MNERKNEAEINLLDTQAEALKAQASKDKEETQSIIDKRIWEVKQEMFEGWKDFIDTANQLWDQMVKWQPTKKTTIDGKEIEIPKYFEIRNDIVMTGYVPNAVLPAIINQCKVFLYPSLRESFGIPILEGMACGVPVITSNTSSMPEIAGDAALLVDPSKPEQIAEAINRILNDDKLRTELCDKGIKQAAGFSWKIMAENYLKLYKEILKA